MRIFIGFFAACLLTSATPVNAQEALEAQLTKVETLIGQVTERLTAVTEDNRTLKQQIANLKQGLGAAAIPSGAVVAFDLPGRCPNGWSDFVEGTSRTIVGAYFDYGAGSGPVLTEDKFGKKLTGRHYRDIGGEAKVTLSVPEMPKHRHGLETVLDNKPLPPPTSTARHVPIAGPYNSRYKRNFYEGADRPHNNMPPFIALYFCKKD